MTTTLTITTEFEADIPYEQHNMGSAEGYLARARNGLSQAQTILEAMVSRLDPLREAAVPPDQSGDLLELQLLEQQARIGLDRITAALDALA